MFWIVMIDCRYILIEKILMNISNNVGVNSDDLAKRGESLIRKSTNRYLTTVKIAFRAKQRRFDDFDGLLEESTIKPVQRSIIELSDEQDQPDLLPGWFWQKIKKNGDYLKIIKKVNIAFWLVLIIGQLSCKKVNLIHSIFCF